MVLLVNVLFLLSVGAGLQFTCYQSEVYGGLYGLCPLVNWRAARIVNETDITEDEVLPVLPYTENRNLVLEWYDKVSNDTDLTASCSTALLHLSCAVHFPYCPAPYDHVSYWPPCRNECLSVKRACGSTVQLDCDQYEENEVLCYRAVSVSEFRILFSGSDRVLVFIFGLFTLLYLLLSISYGTSLAKVRNVVSSQLLVAGSLVINTIFYAVACMSGTVLSHNYGVLSSGWRDCLILFSFLTLFINTWTLLMVSQIPGISSSLSTTGVIGSLILSVLIYALPLFFILFSTEYIAPFWYHFFCLSAFLLLFAYMIVFNSYVLFRQRARMERIFRDGFNPYKHQTFRMYKCARIIRIVLFARLGCVLLQHVLLPWCGVGGAYLSDVLMMMVSDGITLGGIAYVYPERVIDGALTKRRGRR